MVQSCWPDSSKWDEHNQVVNTYTLDPTSFRENYKTKMDWTLRTILTVNIKNTAAYS